MIFHCHVVKESDSDGDGYDPQIGRGELNRKCQRETHQKTDKEETRFHLQYTLYIYTQYDLFKEYLRDYMFRIISKSSFTTLARRDVTRNVSRHLLDDGRVSLAAHLFGKRETSLLQLSPLMKPNGRAARLKAFSIVAGIGTMGSALIYNSIMHPDVQFDKDERQKPIRENHQKARRFASNRRMNQHI